MSRGSQRGMKIPTLTPSTSLRTGLTLSLREREFRVKLIRPDSRGFAKVRAQLLSRGVTYGKSIESSVHRIINDVRVNGDKALIKYTKKFDRVSLTPATLHVDQKAIKEAYNRVSP